MSVNILWVIVVAFILIGAITGYKRGLVEGVMRLITSLLGIVVLFILAKGVGSFLKGSYVNVILALILLIVIHIFHMIGKLILKSCKLVSKLPVVHVLDKIAGLVFGLIENLCFIWLVFIFVEAVNPFDLWTLLEEQINESIVLTIIRETNCMAVILQLLFARTSLW